MNDARSNASLAPQLATSVVAVADGLPVSYDLSAIRLSTCSQPLVLPALPLTDAIGNHGTGNGNVIEFSMLYMPEGWQGFEYWGVISPYDGSTATYENPCIIASHDGHTWFVPPGITNPIAMPPATGHLYDSGLFLAPDRATLILVWCSTTSPNCEIFFSTSTDGVTWAPPTLMAGTTFAIASHYLNTPCLAWDVPNQRWVMYCVDNPNGSAAGPTTPVYLASPATEGNWAAALSGPWTAPVAMTVNGIATTGKNQFAPNETVVWHFDMHPLPSGEIVGLIQTAGNSGGRVYPCKVMASAGSPGTTDLQVGPLMRPQNLPANGNFLYRSSMVPIGNTWQCFFGTIGLGGSVPAPGCRMLTGIAEFDRYPWLQARNAELAAGTSAPITGTAQPMPQFGNYLAYDSFNHATFGVPTSANPSSMTWTPVSGTFSIVGNQLTGASIGNNHAYLATSFSDVAISSWWSVVGAGGGHVTFRYADPSNYWHASLANGYISIQKIVGGSVAYPVIVGTTISNGQVVVSTSDSPQEFLVVAIGPTISFYYNGQKIACVFDAFNSTATGHGVQIADTVSMLKAYLLRAAA